MNLKRTCEWSLSFSIPEGYMSKKQKKGLSMQIEKRGSWKSKFWGAQNPSEAVGMAIQDGTSSILEISVLKER